MGVPPRRSLLLLRTTASLSGPRVVLPELDHDAETGHSSRADATEATRELDVKRMIAPAGWVYHHVEEVLPDFNLVATGVAKRFDIKNRLKRGPPPGGRVEPVRSQ